jgi:hypothetical protein
LGEQFCAEHFPGHQALICTHPDGHNHSGNIHVHIVINSLRIEEIPFLPYMDRPADTKAGCKHRCTDAALRYFKSEVMEMCHREGLYQIDLLNGSKNRVTEREYWVQKKEQAALDKQNAPSSSQSPLHSVSAYGETSVRSLAPPLPTQPASLGLRGDPNVLPIKFETNKEKLRQSIRAALSAATSFEDFSSLLLREGVTVKESRGRLSYLTPDRTKPITARKQLEAAIDIAYAEMWQTSGELKTLETRLQGKKELQRQVLAYAQAKPSRDGLKAQKSPKARDAYRQAHESDFIIAEAAARYSGSMAL